MTAPPGLSERDLPPGFNYREDVITEAEERFLLEAIENVAFSDFEMRGAHGSRAKEPA